MKIAVIGAGIAGLGAALALKDDHDVTVFEKQPRPGGHANTANIAYPMASGEMRDIAVDTGFIVYNEKTYPNLCGFFDHLSVETEWSDMSLGFSIDDSRVEWACDNLNKIFAQRRNLVRPSFIRMARQVLKFNDEALADFQAGMDGDLRIGDWLDQRGYSEEFKLWYLYPMAGAIWSTRSAAIADFSARALFGFYENHELFAGLGGAVQWRTVTGGSQEYVRKVMAALGDRVVLSADVKSVENGGLVRFGDGSQQSFDHVIVATHSDEALHLRKDADAQTRALLSDIQYAPNRAYLHRDETLMPRNKRVWSSWNALTGGDAERKGASLSYWMNRLQNIDKATPLFVTLNPVREPDPALTFLTVDYAHPQYNSAAFAAQDQFDTVQGRGGIWYAGAWLGYGFHEDGLRAGVRIANALGSRPEWVKDVGAPFAVAQMAAE